MGVYSGPDVSESGLVLYLDAGNNKSHSTNRFISYGTGLTTQGISFQVNGDGTFQRIAAGTVIGGYTVRTTDVVYSYALGSNGCHYHGNDVAVPGGSYATFSFDYLVTGATNYPSTDYLANFENLGNTFSNSIGTANNLQNVWQRRSFTSGPTSVNGTLRMLLYPGGCGGRLADSGTIYFRNPKVEFTNVDTGNGNFSSMPNVTTWYDMSGNGNNGTLTNTPYYIMGSNNINNYINFDGTDDYVALPQSFAFGTSTFSIECWVNADTLSGIDAIYYSQSSNAPGFYGVGHYAGSGGFFLGDFNGSTRITTFFGSDAVVNTWYHLVFLKNSSNQYVVYRNAVASTTNNTSTTSLSSSDPRIGYNPATGSEIWDGKIANFKIYNRALSAQEIQQNFNATRSRFGI